MKFLPLFDLQISHTYYSDGRCPDFDIEPTAETHRLLKNFRCILKTIPGGIRILSAATSEGDAFIQLGEGARFKFHLRLQKPDFNLFTDLDEISQTPAPVYTNVDLAPADPVQLTLASRRSWSTESFFVSQPSQNEDYVLSGNPLQGILLKDFVVEGLSNISHPTNYAEDSKVITVNSLAEKRGDIFKVKYESIPNKLWGVFAEIEIHNNISLPGIANNPATFQISFKAKQARWNYYFVTDSKSSRFTIRDSDKNDERRVKFGWGNRTNLSDKPDESDQIAQTLASQYPDLIRLRFVSDDPIPYRNQARKSIQLIYHDEADDYKDHLILKALPNPSMRNSTTVNISDLDGRTHKEAALYQIIKYFAQNNQNTGGN